MGPTIMRGKEEIERKKIFCEGIVSEKQKEYNEEDEANYYAGARDALKWILGEIEEI